MNVKNLIIYVIVGVVVGVILGSNSRFFFEIDATIVAAITGAIVAVVAGVGQTKSKNKER